MIGTLLLNRYKLLEKIGEGGMGIVYKAKCTLLNRFVAIKILKTELSTNENFILRFKREANSIASLSHQNIVNIYDIGSENNINFIVMEYINGKTLNQVIKENTRLTPSYALDIALQMSKALQYAHENNIIHRDIKSDNILITENNTVKLTDFGIAKVTNSATITNSNNIIGSVHYFSPEQAKGKHVDFRTDIYALGIVMYEMFTGNLPFNGDTSISIALMHVQEPVIPPKEIFSNISENINSIILKSLEKEPINRFQTAEDLVKILQSIKENPNLKLNFNNEDINTKTVVLENTLLLHTKIDSTVAENQDIIQETELIKKSNKISPKNYFNIKNQKIILVIIMIIGICALTKYLLKESSSTAKVESSASETKMSDTSYQSDELQVIKDEKKQVPSIIGESLDNAKSIIIANEFLIGNISYEYSDNISEGLVISQSPKSDTLQEKDIQIDLIVSQGQKVIQNTPVISQNKENSNSNNNANSNSNSNQKDTDNTNNNTNDNNNKYNNSKYDNSNNNNKYSNNNKYNNSKDTDKDTDNEKKTKNK